MTTTTNTLIDQLIAVESQIEALKTKQSGLKQLILDAYKEKVDSVLSEKDYGCGSVKLGNLKFEVKKKVEWDQVGLAEMYKKIAASNEDPSEYIETSYTVSEDAYKNWPSSLKDQFTQFRIVTPQKASVHVVEK